MNFNFTTFKKAVLLSLLGGVTITTASAEGLDKIRKIKFTPEFMQEIREAGLPKFDFHILFATSPDSAVFSQKTNKLAYAKGHMTSSEVYLSNSSYVDLDFSKSDTIDLYYFFESENILREKAAVKITQNDLTEGVQINPLEGCHKTVLKRAVGKNGEPVNTNFIMEPVGISSWKNLSRSWDGNSITLNPDHVHAADSKTLTSSFWTEPGKEVLCHMAAAGPYLMVNERYQMPEGEQVDTLCYDFREAKKLVVSINDMEGKQMDIRDLLYKNNFSSCIFQSKFCSGHQIMQKDEITLTHKMNFEGEPINLDAPITSVNVYGFPGDYIFSFWRLSDNGLHKDMPLGLEGLLTIKAEEDEQQMVFDYSKYLTVKLNSNIAPGYEALDYCFRNPSRQPQDNALLDTFVFDKMYRMSDAYTRTGKDANGQTFAHIWPAVNFEMADIEGRVMPSDAVVSAKDVALKTVKELTLDAPDLFKVRATYPKLVRKFSSNMVVDGHVFGIADEYNNFPSDTSEEWLSTDTLEFFLTKGKHLVNFNLEGDWKHDIHYASDLKEIVIGGKEAVTEMDLPWNRAVLLEQQTPDFLEKMEVESIGTTLAETRLTGDSTHQEKLVVFEQEGEYSYSVNAPLYQEQINSLTVGKELLRHKVMVDKENAVRVRNLARRGHIAFKLLSFTGDDGKVTDIYEELQEDSLYRFFLPGKVVAEASKSNLTTNEWMSRYSIPAYRMTFDTHEEQFEELTNQDSEITFINDGNPMFIANTNPEKGEQSNGVKLYFLSSPYVDAKKPLSVVTSRRNPNMIQLFSGNYCAEDTLGNKVYFEVPADQREKMTIDFANPPVPPTGIETAEVSTAKPVAYYDLTGRKLIAPRKGIMLVRLSNGKVIKVIKK